MVWDINTKFSPVVVLMSFQLSTKFEGHNSLKKTAMPLGSSKWKWAWQAHFLSHTYETREICCFFWGVQTLLLSFFENSKLQKMPEPSSPGVQSSLPEHMKHPVIVLVAPRTMLFNSQEHSCTVQGLWHLYALMVWCFCYSCRKLFHLQK